MYGELAVIQAPISAPEWNMLACLQYHRAKEGSTAKAEAGLNLMRTVNHRMHIDKSVELVGKLLFGVQAGPTMLTAVRSHELPLVDDWSCLKGMVSNVTI